MRLGAHDGADRHARHPRAGAEPSAAGAGLRAAGARAPDDRHVERGARVRLAGPQGGAGHGGRRRLLQRLRAARRVPHHRAPDGRRGGALPGVRAGPPAPELGRDRRRHARMRRRSSAAPPTRTCTSTAGGGPVASRPPPASAGASPTRSPAASRTRTSRRSPSTASSPARSSTSTAPPPWPTERRASVQLIECPWCGPREEVEFHYGGQAHVAYPEDPAALSDEQWAHYVFFRDNTKGRVRRAVEPQPRLPPLVQRDPRHHHLPLRARLPPRRAAADDPRAVTRMTHLPHRRGRPHRPRHHPRVHLRRAALHRPPRRHPRLGAARRRAATRSPRA